MHNPIIVDLGFGDAGKGTMVDYLTDADSVVVRYNGGPQCAHNVVTPDGRHHTFSQFGSGTFNGARTHLSRFMLVNPISMLNEAHHLREIGVGDALSRTTVDPRATIVTRFHVAANRIKEIARGNQRHGSTGQGVGETVNDSLNRGGRVKVADIAGSVEFALEQTRLRMLEEVKPWYDRIAGQDDGTVEQEWTILNDEDVYIYADQYRLWAGLVEQRHDDWIADADGRLVFEGAQGVLLDETHGFAPYNTWSNTTAENAFHLLNDVGLTGQVLGVLRTYMTRHGAGPLPTEDAIDREELHNGVGKYQGAFRTGALDLPLLWYARTVWPVHSLAITHVDRLTVMDNPVAVGPWPISQDEVWDYTPVIEGWSEQGFVERVSGYLNTPVAYTSHGPTRNDKMSLAAAAV